MVNGGEQYVASLLFHELAHQKLYVKDDSEFSEAFAMVVEELGTERWLAQHGDGGGSRALSRCGASGARSSASSSLRNRRGFARSMRAARRPSSCARRRQRAFDTLRAEYAALKATWRGNTDYDAWFAQPLNNATLASVATYTHWLPALRARWQEVGLAAFYADTAAVAKLDAEERAEQLALGTRERARARRRAPCASASR